MKIDTKSKFATLTVLPTFSSIQLTLLPSNINVNPLPVLYFLYSLPACPLLRPIITPTLDG